MIDRRLFLRSTAALVTAPFLAGRAAAGTAALKIASVKFGSLSWLFETIRAEGLDKKYGLNFEVIEIASNQGSAIALYGGSADVVVSDWTWGLRQRSMGEALKFAPFSSALGSIMVAGDSPIKSYDDLAGKRLPRRPDLRHQVARILYPSRAEFRIACPLRTHGFRIACFGRCQQGHGSLVGRVHCGDVDT